MRALLVVNPHTGGGRGPTFLDQIRQRLSATGLDAQPVEAAGPKEVALALGDALRHESPEEVRVIVAGGDGTINAALPALIGTSFPMAILPVGSVNVLAREMGIPLAIEEAIGVAAGGRLRRVDLGVADGRPFALMAGLGFDAAVVHSVAPQVKNLVGSFAYVARGLSLLARHRRSRFRISTDQGGFEADAWLAVVANASRYTYRWRLAPEARIDDGCLDLCLFQSQSAAETTGQVIAALIGRHRNHPGVRHVRARELRFECDPPVCLQVDGEAAGESPTDVHVVPEGLTVVTPGKGRGA
ncbi:MAG: diacylglycerol kinase family lipid kinase [Armatimonadota bacterium]|nr:MAG: diacylglycerol kinase family lipid kinase [Armatimonadota bacterium]